MKHWLESRRVFEGRSAADARGVAAALATVVRVRGSAYRRSGAKLLVLEDGTTIGNVSGGCLEEDVREVALQVMAAGRTERRSYCSAADPIDAWDLGVGCEGEVEVFVQPAVPALSIALEFLAGDESFALCTICEEGASAPTGALVVDRSGTAGTLGDAALDAMVAGAARLLPEGSPSALHQIGGRTIFIDRFAPPPNLVVFGAGEDAPPLVRLAVETGFRVTVVDRRSGRLQPNRFPSEVRLVRASGTELHERLVLRGDCFALLMTHNFADDSAYASALAGRPLRYVGFLGPRARTERILQAPRTALLADDARVHGPVGLDLGAEGAEQVAVAIIAELLSVRSGRSATPLRERSAPIHTVDARG